MAEVSVAITDDTSVDRTVDVMIVQVAVDVTTGQSDSAVGAAEAKANNEARKAAVWDFILKECYSA